MKLWKTVLQQEKDSGHLERVTSRVLLVFTI